MADDDDLDFHSEEASQNSEELLTPSSKATASRSTQSSRTSSAKTSPTSSSSKTSQTLSSRKSSILSARGRTKAQRLKAAAQQRECSQDSSLLSQSTTTSPGRRVRFTLLNESTQESQLTNASSQTSTKTTTSSSSRTSSTHSKRQRQRRRPRFSAPPNWLEDIDEEQESKHHKTPQQLFGAMMMPSKVKGAGMDIFAVQDSGNYQMLYDESTFLCSTIASAKSATTLALEAASDLGWLLSSKRNRQTLLFQNNGLAHSSTQGTALQAVLDMLGCINTLIGRNTNYASKSTDEEQETAVGSASRTKSSRCKRQFVAENEVDVPLALLSGNTRQLLDALAMIVHFLSIDCTLSNRAASKSPLAAQKIRKAILSHADAMQGILCLVLADPIIPALRGRMKESVTGALSTAEIMSSPLPSISVPEDKSADSCTSSVGDSQSLASIGTPDSQASGGSVDPTAAGRRRRKKRRMEAQQASFAKLETIAEDAKPPAAVDDKLSFTSDSPKSKGDDQSLHSTDTQLSKMRHQLDRVASRVLESLDKVGTQSHSCGTEHDGPMLSLPLLALSRIVTGKAGEDEESCMDANNDEHDELDFDLTETDQDEDERNPLLLTNRLLDESGVIPLLSLAMAETLAAVSTQLKQSKGQAKQCNACVDYLHERVHMLALLVDGACLLNDANRSRLSEEGYTAESGGYLIVGLISVLKSLLDSGKVFDDGTWGEITLETLRTLTSLTHDNEVASRELEMSFSDIGWKETGCGLDVIGKVLYVAVTEEGSSLTDKLRYDCVIFCLNTLANVVESGGTQKVLAAMKTPVNDDELFLRWLTRWLVGETTSFREAVVGSTFGSSPSKHARRQLDKQEDDKLVTAGNGFVLLACLLIGKGESSDYELSQQLRDLILRELPGDDEKGKLTFVKNTLKAFCNFYHYSIGDLSVAVVAPVKKLILEIEALQGEFEHSISDTS